MSRIVRIIQHELKKTARADKAKILARFFKTGPGEYAEGDRFIGVMVQDKRKIVKAYADKVSLKDVEELLRSAINEERLAALLLMVALYKKSDEQMRENIFKLYIRNTKYINNWDLVDLTAPQIVGGFLNDKKKKLLDKLARSKNLWERRIAVLATFYFIYHGSSKETFRIAEILLRDPHDLIHKAVGWMLREVGKRCSEKELEGFLKKYYRDMPRTMLRYAIERLPEKKRIRYLTR